MSAASHLTPRAGARVQLFAASIVWAVGAAILLVRGVLYVHDRSWHSWLLGGGLALVIAIPKTRFILDRVANKAVARIHQRGKACFFGFFSWKSWLFVIAMMGTGIVLRRTVVNPGEFGAGIMGALYLGIGAGLAAADRIFWKAAFSPIPAPESLDADPSEQSAGAHEEEQR